MRLEEILEQELNREWTEEEKQRAKELTHTKNCKDCFYNVKNLCYVDGHDINYDVYRAYSCKYYKYYENNKQQK